MRATSRNPNASESSDAVGLIVALLVRFPEIATIVSHPNEGTLELSFAVSQRFDAKLEHAVREAVVDHVGALLAVTGEQHEVLEVTCERDQRMTFVHVRRDVRSFSREELAMVTALLSQRFGAALVQSPAAEDEIAEDVAAADELVEYAIEALRDPGQQKSLVGFREEKRVLVYFVKSRKKAKARARS